jgi:hypothetical protein
MVDFGMSDAQWDSLRVPVSRVLFFYSTPAGRVLAYYPGPMGATESILQFETYGGESMPAKSLTRQFFVEHDDETGPSA